MTGLLEKGIVKSKKRGQPAVEFMVIVAMLSIMLLGVYFMTLGQGSEARSKKELIDGFAVCEDVAAEINNAVSIGDGYSREFYLPYYVGESTAYVIALVPQEQAVEVSWGDYSCRLQVLSSTFSGTPRPGQNLVSNKNGVITFG